MFCFFSFSAIVKLQMRYQNQDENDPSWGMGTGWLIRDDLLVTAGHCVYDWANGYGPIVAIKAYIGYNGKASIVSDPSVQFRLGKRVTTTAEWLSSRENRNNDVAFVQLDRPFTGNLRTFSYEATPSEGVDFLGVVGYPGDKELKGERGALMYEEFTSVKFNLDTNPLHMLNYKISTFGGMSLPDVPIS
jgi:V8-like Glu-specific endopeptidase